MVSRTSFALAALTVAALVLGACGDDSEDSTGDADDTVDASDQTEGGDEAGEGDVTIAMEDFAFSPGELTVPPRTEITIENRDGTAHTVTSDDEGAFDSGQIGGGTEGVLSAPSESGTYEFFCEIHPNMTGTLVVED